MKLHHNEIVKRFTLVKELYREVDGRYMVDCQYLIPLIILPSIMELNEFNEMEVRFQAGVSKSVGKMN